MNKIIPWVVGGAAVLTLVVVVGVNMIKREQREHVINTQIQLPLAAKTTLHAVPENLHTMNSPYEEYQVPYTILGVAASNTDIIIFNVATSTEGPYESTGFIIYDTSKKSPRSALVPFSLLRSDEYVLFMGALFISRNSISAYETQEFNYNTSPIGITRYDLTKSILQDVTPKGVEVGDNIEGVKTNVKNSSKIGLFSIQVVNGILDLTLERAVPGSKYYPSFTKQDEFTWDQYGNQFSPRVMSGDIIQYR